MINISELTTDQKTIASALSGKWERKATADVTWVILGQVVFLDGDKEQFPYNVIQWHDCGNNGYWGILSNTAKRK